MTMTNELSTGRDRLARDTVELFVDAIARRDFDSARCRLAPAVALQAVLPSGVGRWQGVEAVLGQLEGWLSPYWIAWGTTFEVVQAAGRGYRTGWRLEGHIGECGSRRAIEQTCVARVGPDGIERIELSGGGHRPAAWL